MGVVVSTDTVLAPISLASIIIGFASFAFTLGTFLKVVWVNLETFSEHPHTVHTYLTTLRQELLEERASLRVAKKYIRHRRRSGSFGGLPQPLKELLSVDLDDVSIKTMSDTIRHLIRNFEEIERPFLADAEDGITQMTRRRRQNSRRRGDDSPSPHRAHSPTYNTSSPPYEKRDKSEERRHADNKEHEDDMFWAQRVRYGKFNTWRRFLWLYKKGHAQRLFDTLSRVQTRRIARQVNGMAVIMREYGDRTVDTHDVVLGIEERLNRVVGLRRV